MTDFEIKLQALLILHEGEVLTTYKCPAGFWTVGVGHNLQANPLPDVKIGDTISQQRSREILSRDVAHCFLALEKHLPWSERLADARLAVLIDMCFNLGMWGLLKFKNTLAAIEAGDYEKASLMMLQSKWAGQVGKRAIRLSTMMKTGEWP